MLYSPPVFPSGVPSFESISPELTKLISYLKEEFKLKKNSGLEASDSPSVTSISA